MDLAGICCPSVAYLAIWTCLLMSAYGYSWLLDWPLAGPWLAHGCHKAEYDWALMSTAGNLTLLTCPDWQGLLLLAMTLHGWTCMGYAEYG